MKRLFFGLLILAFGCRDTLIAEGPCSTAVDDDFVRSYFDFNIGTLWVYRESNSGELDSVEVFYHTPMIPSNPIDFYWLASSSKRDYNYFQNYFEDDHGLVNNQINGCLRNVVYAGYETPEGQSARKKAFFIGVSKGESLPSDYSFYLASLDTLLLNGVNYRDVLIYLNDNDGCFNYDSVEYYIADHYGIVRFKNLTNGECWDLVESSIVK